MAKSKFTVTRGCLILVAIVLAIPLLILSGVGVQTWLPLREAGESLAELDQSLGVGAAYEPSSSGVIPVERLELFLELRETMVSACGDYDVVQEGFDSVTMLETEETGDLTDVGAVFSDLGSAALAITPYLARFFELRNDALLEASMGLEEYCYIYAIAYHDLLLADSTRREIFSAGDPLSPDASLRLQECLARQLETAPPASVGQLDVELEAMAADSTRLIWQGGIPAAIRENLIPYRVRLDALFCPATAGLEMERDPERAIWLALE